MSALFRSILQSQSSNKYFKANVYTFQGCVRILIALYNQSLKDALQGAILNVRLYNIIDDINEKDRVFLVNGYK